MEFLMGNPKNIIPTERFLEKIRGYESNSKADRDSGDNAVKYADEGGEMRPKSGNRRQILHNLTER